MVLVGSETICDRWKTDMVEIMSEEEEEEHSGSCLVTRHFFV